MRPQSSSLGSASRLISRGRGCEQTRKGPGRPPRRQREIVVCNWDGHLLLWNPPQSFRMAPPSPICNGNHQECQTGGLKWRRYDIRLLRLLTPLMVIALVEIALGAAQSPTLVSAKTDAALSTQRKVSTSLRTAVEALGRSYGISESRRRPAGDHRNLPQVRIRCAQNIDLNWVSTNPFPDSVLWDGGQAGSTLHRRIRRDRHAHGPHNYRRTGATAGINIPPQLWRRDFSNGGNLTLIACAGQPAIEEQSVTADGGEYGTPWFAPSSGSHSRGCGNVADNEGGGIFPTQAASVSVMESTNGERDPSRAISAEGVGNFRRVPIDASTVTANLPPPPPPRQLFGRWRDSTILVR
jgi:hypothetical protein